MRNLPNNLVTSVKSESDSMEMQMSAGTLEACRRISLWILPDDEASFMPDRVKAIGGREKNIISY
jgi:anti-sigma-K factor RskA